MIIDIFLQSAPAAGGSSTLIMMLLMFVIIYFFMIRPQSKKAKEEKKYIESIKKGDRVVTIGGIHGRITDLGDTTMTLEIDSNVRVKVERKAISADATKALQVNTNTEVAK